MEGQSRASAGAPGLHFHDLRHTGGTLAAVTGATLKELMARLGHSSPRAAVIYQHATQDRDQAIAKALGGLARQARVSITTRPTRQATPAASSVCSGMTPELVNSYLQACRSRQKI